MKFRKLLLVSAVLLMTTSCRPTSLWLVEAEGPPDYKLGWEDGCDSGLSAEDEGFMYRAVYGFKKRPEMLDNDNYGHGWREGFQYCRLMLDSAQK